MTESILVTRTFDGDLYFQDETFPQRDEEWKGTEEQLHDYLCRNGWLRVGPAKDDVIAGLYVRKVVA